ncbi:hypothetical protein FHW20_003936 [Ochrobactrum intermedium]|uniref:Uncharacterized protein n=1 Tax=Brucella intermedia TaxID=94625 RepID=A0ABR6AUA0_9HYPH|nr:hypothetical protein [Brucella intermedia]
MSKCIVDVFETIKVQKKNDRRLASGMCGFQPFFQILPEQNTIGQTGQSIVVRIVFKPKVLGLQFPSRLSKIARQALHAAMRPIKKLVVAKQKDNQHYPANDKARRQTGVDEMQLTHFRLCRIDKSYVIFDGRRGKRCHRPIKHTHRVQDRFDTVYVQLIELTIKRLQNIAQFQKQITALRIVLNEGSQIALLQQFQPTQHNIETKP